MASRIARRSRHRDPSSRGASDNSTRSLVKWLKSKYVGVRYNADTQQGAASTGFLDIKFHESGNDPLTWVEIKVKPFKTSGEEAARVIDAFTKVLRTV